VSKRMVSIDLIADQYVDRAAALDPLLATSVGIAGHDDEMPDLSVDGFAARAELDRSTLAALEAAEGPGPREQVARAAMQERLGLAVECYDAGDTTSQLRRSGCALSCIASWAGPVRPRPTCWARRSGCRPGRKPEIGPKMPSALKDFHSRALGLGPMGLDPLRQALARL
jgi:uncharacterized protein (DUF885 family)